MRVSFDKLNRFDAPIFHLCNPGCKYEDGLLTGAIGILSSTSDEELVANFNAESELNLRVYLVEHDDLAVNAETKRIFKAVQNRREIFVDDIGFFVIANVKNGYDGYRRYKDVTAYSCEREFEDKAMPYIDGTYPLLTTGSTEGLLTMLVQQLPLWSIAHVDNTLKSLYRTFEDISDETNILAFMLNEMQDAYECIFIFDTVNRTVSVYDQNTYLHETDIHLTVDDLIESMDITEESNDLYTAISVFGEDDITISAVNPLGTTVIYNFDYYLDWMSDGLREKVKSWEDLLKYYANEDGQTPSSDDYMQIGSDYADAYSAYLAKDAELNRLNTQRNLYQRCYDNIVAVGGNSLVPGYNDAIEEAGGDPIPVDIEDVTELQAAVQDMIDDVQADIDTATADRDAAYTAMNALQTRMREINAEVSISSYFTEEEYNELAMYVNEGVYTDPYIAITDIMTYSEQYGQMRVLYERAVEQLKRISVPTQEYSLDVENFLFQKEFIHFSQQLETGCIVNIEVDENDVAPLFLSSFTVNYYDRKLSMTFGNRINKYDPKSMFDNVLGDIRRTANTVEYLRQLVEPIKNGELTEIQTELAISRDITKDRALSAVNQSVVIDDTGYTGKKLLADGTYDPRQIKIVNNSIVFTRDAWETCSTAIGEIALIDEDGNTYTVYGINAEVLMGHVILGDVLQIGYTDSVTGETKDLVSTVENTISDVSMQYYVSTSATEVTGGSWSDTQPSSHPAGTYLWVRDVYTYVDGSTTMGEPVCTEGVPGEDGESPITIQIESSNGNIFYRTGVQTILSCHVFDGRGEITNTLTNNSFDWRKMNDDGTEDTDWYANNVHTGPTIVIDNEDVFNRAVFICNVIV